MSKNKTENEILELITLVDARYERKFLDAFLHDPHFGISVGLLFTMSVVLIYSFSNIFSNYYDIGEQVAVAVAFSALIISFTNTISPSLDKTVIRRNYEQLHTNVKEIQKPLLMALIKLKNKNPKFDLKLIYSQNKEMFTTNKLLETLYE